MSLGNATVMLPVTSWLIALAIGLITFYLTKLWVRIRELPPGPLPLPLIGNLLMFRSQKHVREMAVDLKQRYGGIFTVWMANQPFVVVADWEIAKEALLLKRNDIISRPTLRSMRLGHYYVTNIVFENDLPKWERSRKIGAGAIRNFAESETMAMIVKDAIDEFIGKTITIEEPFDPSELIKLTVINVISKTAFGADALTDEESHELVQAFKEFHEVASNNPADLSPLLLVFFYKKDQILKKVLAKFGEIVHKKYIINAESYKSGSVRNFADAILAAEIEANSEETTTTNEHPEETATANGHAHDENTWKILGDLFLAGTDTSTQALNWLILMVANYPELQTKIREELDRNIGDRMPLQSDRKNCPYTWAFISETLRFRSPVPLGVPHTATVDTLLGEHKIRKGTVVVFDSDLMHMDSDIWEEPEKFDPIRFLHQDGTFNNECRKGFLSFGEGKRKCIGEKLARNDLFLTLANLLRKVEIKLGSASVNLEPRNDPLFFIPNSYEIRVEKR